MKLPFLYMYFVYFCISYVYILYFVGSKFHWNMGQKKSGILNSDSSKTSHLCLIHRVQHPARRAASDPCQHPTPHCSSLTPPPPRHGTSSHLESTYGPSQGSSAPCDSGNIKVHLQWFISLTLISCPSKGRGLAVSCLFARQFYLSITKPSAVLQRPQHCINPLSASQPSITPLSITSDPSSAHLSHTARARR